MVKKPTFLPTCPLCAHFFLKTGQAESLVALRFARSLPTFPLFFLNRSKKIEIISYNARIFLKRALKMQMSML